jgi:alginate O-acetyltransferase complex protein AlgJ
MTSKTFSSPATGRLQGVAMVVVLAAGLGLGVAAIMTEAAQRQLASALDFKSILSGRAASVVNTAMAHNLPVDVLFRTAGGILRWRLFNSGGPQVWAGRNDWLYLMEELRPWPDAAAVMQTRAAVVGRVAASLKARNIDLVVAVVPDKARIVTDAMDGPRAAQTQPRYADFMAEITKQGIKTVDLAAPMLADPQRDRLFWRTDTHWSQEGAALAANTIAASVSSKIDRSTKFKTTADPAETDGPGDLLRLISLDKVPDNLPIALRPPIDRQHKETTKAAETDAAAGGLLDDGPVIQVALIGSSFSVNANFSGRLQEALGAPVTNFAEAGGGFAGAAQKYFNGLAYKQTPPKLIIWEIPERLVVQPFTPDDKALEAAFPKQP